MSIGIPIKLLHEAEKHIVTVELKTGELYRGQLLETEDNMNLTMAKVTVTGRDGRVSTLEHAYIRGSKVRFMIIPDMLKNAPMFKRAEKGAGRGLGRGRAAAIAAKGARGGGGRGR
eukprot:TRINITY_DN3793_c2_g1_i1.p1 TRINITY_DN3793_c2_g1~~TRINITY_DN3793_c2_g1_i1.p1  ORF type:complete len:128 (-),score=17.16 TRINITY_DN3793_c2_g1_i1:332-679(-)